MTAKSLNPHPAYRPDIDGLRAVAVLAVVVYHAFPTKGGGGFIGVDIFFVLSGYLISTIIFTGVDTGRFSYADFYDRRIRRIFPALILVLAVCLLFAVTMAFPVDARAIGKQVLGGAGFAANLVFWNEAGYFDGKSEFKPLLHLWSLSVEEQYYIVWPLIVGLLWKRRTLFLGALVLLMAASFALNIASITSEHRDAAFYSPLSRAWELLLGSWLAYRHFKRPVGALPANVGAAIANGLSLCGALLIAVGLAAIRPKSAFPGWWALLPTIGTLCLIGAGSHAGFNRAVLSSRVLVFFGKISYPLYLWHWPLLVLPTIYFGYADRKTRLAALAVAVALSWLTYRWIEKPIRYGSKRPSIPFVLAGISASFAACGALLMASDGWLNRLPPEMRDISLAQADFDYRSYRDHTCFLAFDQKAEAFAAECDPPHRPKTRRVTLWGDSHAASLYPGMLVLMADEGRHFDLGQFTASACPPVIGMSIHDRPHCRAINDAVWKRLSEHPPDTVVLAANWTFYNGENGWAQIDFQAVEATARGLREAGVRHVVVVGPLARWVVPEPLVLLREWRDDGVVPLRSLNSFNTACFDVDAAVREAARKAGVDFISPVERLCDEAGCLRTVTSGGRRYPVAWDDAHLTVPASKRFAREWLGPWLAATDSGTP